MQTAILIGKTLVIGVPIPCLALRKNILVVDCNEVIQISKQLKKNKWNLIIFNNNKLNNKNVKYVDTDNIIQLLMNNNEIIRLFNYLDINYYEIKAPLVGTFYSAAKPSDPPFVNVGDTITKGQVICIIEAMKIFNDIESDISGIVHEVCAENGSPVEYDQVIMKILPE